ncbi:hypothetical protein [Streptomyces sp. 8N706]|uniref:hypothetical protein n=1 Tax=Streptomyces sp. 8N706 TaxID=3457416 RepID=UPI003FD69497
MKIAQIRQRDPVCKPAGSLRAVLENREKWMALASVIVVITQLVTLIIYRS